MRELDADAPIRRGTPEITNRNPEDAESRFRDTLRALENTPEPDHPALIGTLSALSQLLVDQGAFEEAESFLTRALQLSETAGSADGEDLPILLLELSRLYILQSAYERAERPLLRLLAITEAHGDDRPEVATVLASLAAVRHALGDYTSA
jgi:tetratricopeptide (TPR) repeat protein